MEKSVLKLRMYLSFFVFALSKFIPIWLQFNNTGSGGHKSEGAYPIVIATGSVFQILVN